MAASSFTQRHGRPRPPPCQPPGNYNASNPDMYNASNPGRQPGSRQQMDLTHTPISVTPCHSLIDICVSEIADRYLRQ
jgi:hypothetical protein